MFNFNHVNYMYTVIFIFDEIKSMGLLFLCVQVHIDCLGSKRRDLADYTLSYNLAVSERILLCTI